ncbi:hypothetical protein ALI144C_33210 [Actinosynnema sp. ALI-1.44]|uniref:hypothetical protein n=1 Tax=Actinosynnema sp. ALI-1.44 TaxID=1933779 RepID=UPI00097BB511|nr:hypothetical protein [Actinosynnema sp. ALI-1.44]ONI76981.1 hypothetical protein ALI144C_33210 [Actinosynnema sp. ALI-1.44]
MATKSNPGGGGGGGSSSGSGGSSSGGGGSNSFGFGPDTRIAVDTQSLYGAANHFDDLRESIHVFARNSEEYVTYAPLVNGETDETWNRFSPEYVKGAQVFVTGVHGLSSAVGQICESLIKYAAFCAATEANNEYIGKNALNVKVQAPGSDSSTDEGES